MSTYRMHGADPEDIETIISTHPALPNTYLVFAFKDGRHSMEPVLMWGLTGDCTAHPITLDGVWGGVMNANMFVLFPDGKCAKRDQTWEDIRGAIAEVGQLDRG